MVGASINQERYSFRVANMLKDHGHDLELFGIKRGKIRGISIKNNWSEIKEIDTVTMYMAPRHQKLYFEPIIALNPRRIIFNPGSENPVFYELLKSKEIEIVIACTLVMLSTNQY